MKKLLLGFLIFLSVNVIAQQKGISYQALIINPNDISAPGYNAVGMPLANKNICISFQILDAANQLEYQESQTIITDQFGMVNMVIGAGTKIGGFALNFSSISWSLATKTLVVAVNTEGTCSNYTEISSQVLNYVPYSLYADDANIKDGFITSAKLADGSVTDAKVAIGISATKVGLGNVNNTSDANKPISNATQLALNLKEDAINKSTATALGNSDILYPTQNAVKTYVDGSSSFLSTAITAEVTRAQATETVINSDLTAEKTRALTAEALKEDAVNKSTNTTLGNSDALFPTQNAVKNYVDGSSSFLSTAITAEVTRAQATETVINSDLTAEKTRALTAEALKEDAVNKSTNTTLGNSDDLYPTQNAVKTYVDARVIGATIADADATTKGKIQLAGDLTGTADAPLVADGAISNAKISDVSASKITGVVAVANGGSGANTLTGYLKGNGTNAFTTVANIPLADIDGAVKKVNGAAPDVDGNVTISFGSVTTGTLASRPLTAGTNGNIYVVSSDPTSENNGRTYISDGTNWQEVTTNTAATDARYLRLAGGTMVGNLIIPSTKYITLTDLPTNVTDAANKNYVDTKFNTFTVADGSITDVKISSGISASKVGLGNVNNTSDLNKPISTAAQTAIDNKESALTAGSTAQYYRGDKTWQTLDKSVIGLGNVDNTSDANKPISTFTQTALNLKAPISSPTFTGTLTTPILIAGTNTYPITRGLTGQFLKTDGSGNLSWSTATGISTQVNPVAYGESAGQTSQANDAVAIGKQAGQFSQYSFSVALGSYSGQNSQGTNAVAIGRNSGNQSQGEGTTAIGTSAGQSNQGIYSVAIGSYASTNGQGNFSISIGNASSTTGLNAIAIGKEAYATAENAISIGSGVSNSTVNTIKLGNSSITSIAGQVGFTAYSDSRLKRDISNSKYGLKTVMSLRPVDYTLIGNNLRQVGFIAQEMKVLITEVVTGKEGDLAKGEVLGITYGNLVPVLTKAIQEQQLQIEVLQKGNEASKAQIEKLTLLVEKLLKDKK